MLLWSRRCRTRELPRCAKALSTYLGHATIQITLDLYGHLFPGNGSEAASLLDSYFARQIDGSTVAQTVARTPRKWRLRANTQLCTTSSTART